MESEESACVAVVTGANTGIGFSLCERLVKDFPTITLCLACRNKEKAEQAASKLKALNSKAKISYVVLDTSSLKSVFTAAEQLKKKFHHIDYLYFNAGTMSVTGVKWSHVLKGLFSTNCIHMLLTGDGLLIHNDSVTEDGLQCVFATNIFGHYILLKELQSRMEETHKLNRRPGQVIWTSSSNALENNFSLDDIQHTKGVDPYSSSKYLMDSMALGLNERMNKQNVYVHTTCPGLVSTNLTHGILPVWFWSLLLPFLFLIRIFMPSFTHSPENGAEALFWLANQDPASVGSNVKMCSRCSASGKPYIYREKLKMSEEFSETLLKQLDSLEVKFRKKFNMQAH